MTKRHLAPEVCGAALVAALLLLALGKEGATQPGQLSVVSWLTMRVSSPVVEGTRVQRAIIESRRRSSSPA